MATHQLKTWPCFFRKIVDGEKTFEMRKNDRNYLAGDVLLLREFDKNKDGYTGREALFRVTYVHAGVGVCDGYCVLAIIPIRTAQVHGVKATVNPQSSIGNPQPAVGNPQPAACSQQSSIGNHQSATGNPQSSGGSRCCHKKDKLLPLTYGGKLGRGR